ncbi:hypothetical protein Nizo2264_0181 [Lactiplantibacillus plantarum]|nr:hypothetical protein Nizo2264_0181 [Lactiplantibacillus plantarum]
MIFKFYVSFLVTQFLDCHFVATILSWLTVLNFLARPFNLNYFFESQTSTLKSVD